jgi:phosphosulfolactate synthase
MPSSNGSIDSNGFLGVPARSPKPRTHGLTHVIDKGLNLRDIEGLFDTGGEYVDVVKFGWGTSYVTKNLEKKISLYRSFETPVVCGGTLFEAVIARNKLDQYRSWLTENRFSHVEVSDGTIDLPRERKLELIEELARDFVVLSEVGSKDSEVVFAPYQWVQWMKEELEAGAWKVITEGREGGTAGIFRPTGEMRHYLRGSHQGLAGIFCEALRPRGEPRQHPAGGSHPARDAQARAPGRHPEGDLAR